jgi:branched-chain amino acid transport system substrate-binding protein
VVLRDLHSDFSLELADTFVREFENMGGKVLEVLEYKQKEPEFRPLLKKAAQLKPDVLVTTGHDESAIIVTLAQELEIEADMVGGDGWSTRSFMERGGRQVKQGYYVDHWAGAAQGPEARAFIEQCGDHGQPDASAALAYDAAMILAEALRRAETASDPAKIRDALAQTKDFPGVTGKITFDQHGDPIKSAVIMQIIDGVPLFLKTIHPK